MIKRRRKLTDAQAKAARIAYANGARRVDLVRQLGMSDASLGDLLCGRTYKVAGGPVTITEERRERRETRVLRERIAELEARLEDAEFELEEMRAPPPAFADPQLTRSEMYLLGALMRRPGVVHTHNQLMAASQTCSVKTLQVLAARLRRKVPGISIEAVWGVGYVGRLAS